MPEAMGRFFSNTRAAWGSMPAASASRRAARNTRLSASADKGPPKGPVTLSDRSPAANAGRQPVTDIGENDKAVEQMITIRPAPDDTQGQVHFRRGETLDGGLIQHRGTRRQFAGGKAGRLDLQLGQQLALQIGRRVQLQSAAPLEDGLQMLAGRRIGIAQNGH